MLNEQSREIGEMFQGAMRDVGTTPQEVAAALKCDEAAISRMVHGDAHVFADRLLLLDPPVGRAFAARFVARFGVPVVPESAIQWLRLIFEAVGQRAMVKAELGGAATSRRRVG
ncbi:hypothetical protein LLG88_13555 [bacterium]|nr:hypothetical protein [bacterium]